MLRWAVNWVQEDQSYSGSRQMWKRAQELKSLSKSHFILPFLFWLCKMRWFHLSSFEILWGRANWLISTQVRQTAPPWCFSVLYFPGSCHCRGWKQPWDTELERYPITVGVGARVLPLLSYCQGGNSFEQAFSSQDNPHSTGGLIWAGGSRSCTWHFQSLLGHKAPDYCEGNLTTF